MNEPAAETRNFEESLLDLERMVRELEDGRLGLEESLARYEQGVRLIKACYEQLRDAEQRIHLLSGVDGSDTPVLQPLKHEATAAARNPTPRPVRRRPEEIL
jgi:exodeoxyribonuclease VII small subunit